MRRRDLRRDRRSHETQAHAGVVPACWAKAVWKVFEVLGVGRSEMTDDTFRAFVREALDNSKKIEHLDEQEWREFAERLHYLAGELDSDETYRKVAARLDELASEGASQNHLFYLATPPSLAAAIVKGLGKANLADENEHWSRIVIEKPFGRDRRIGESFERDHR